MAGAIVKSSGTNQQLVERKAALQLVREEIDLTCEIFGMEENDAKHMKRAFFLAEVSNGLVPDAFKGDHRSLYIMSKKAEQMNLDIIEVLQAGYFVHGKWGWSAEFMINRVLAVGFFSKIKYEAGGEVKDGTAWMRAIGIYPDGSEAPGTVVSQKMAVEEGWATKNGSKWKSMPALMLKKRASSFMIREYAPHVFGGETRSDDELEDIGTQARRLPDGTKATVLDADTNSPVAYDQQAGQDRDEHQRQEVVERIEKKIVEKNLTGDQIIALEADLGRSLESIPDIRDMETLLGIWEMIK